MEAFDRKKKNAVKITRYNRIPEHLVGKVELLKCKTALLPDPAVLVRKLARITNQLLSLMCRSASKKPLKTRPKRETNPAKRGNTSSPRNASATAPAAWVPRASSTRLW